MTILSNMATAVISTNEAMHYLHSLWHGLPIIPATIGLSGFEWSANFVEEQKEGVVPKTLRKM